MSRSRSNVVVCKCETVIRSELVTCIRRGAFTLERVGQLCGAGTGCGGCRGVIEALICEEQARREARRSETDQDSARGGAQLDLFGLAGN